MTTSVPAGWYPDASMPGHERWWDGQSWTSSTRFAGEATSAADAADAASTTGSATGGHDSYGSSDAYGSSASHNSTSEVDSSRYDGSYAGGSAAAEPTDSSSDHAVSTDYGSDSGSIHSGSTGDAGYQMASGASAGAAAGDLAARASQSASEFNWAPASGVARHSVSDAAQSAVESTSGSATDAANAAKDAAGGAYASFNQNVTDASVTARDAAAQTQQGAASAFDRAGQAAGSAVGSAPEAASQVFGQASGSAQQAAQQASDAAQTTIGSYDSTPYAAPQGNPYAPTHQGDVQQPAQPTSGQFGVPQYNPGVAPPVQGQYSATPPAQGQYSATPPYQAPYETSAAGYPVGAPAGYGLTPGIGELGNQWARLGARFIDGLVLLLPIGLFGSPFISQINQVVSDALDYLNTLDPEAQPDFSPFVGPYVSGFLGLLVVAALVNAIYFIVGTGWKGTTVGKYLLGLKIVDATAGAKPSWGAAIMRWAATDLPTIILQGLWSLIDSIWCLFDTRRQCLHDKAAKTVVVKR